MSVLGKCCWRGRQCALHGPLAPARPQPHPQVLPVRPHTPRPQAPVYTDPPPLEQSTRALDLDVTLGSLLGSTWSRVQAEQVSVPLPGGSAGRERNAGRMPWCVLGQVHTPAFRVGWEGGVQSAGCCRWHVPLAVEGVWVPRGLGSWRDVNVKWAPGGHWSPLRQRLPALTHLASLGQELGGHVGSRGGGFWGLGEKAARATVCRWPVSHSLSCHLKNQPACFWLCSGHPTGHPMLALPTADCRPGAQAGASPCGSHHPGRHGECASAFG